MQSAPFYAESARGPEGGHAVWWNTSDGARVRLAHWPAASHAPQGQLGTVLLLPGRSEYVEKYGQTATVLTSAGWHVVTIDWRGQGLASRHHPDPMLGHVEDFREYQTDVAALLQFIAALGLPEPLQMLSHSMGGCIGLRAMLEGLAVRSAVFSAPMWGIKLFPTVRPVAVNLASLLHEKGHGLRLTPTTTRSSYVLHSGFRWNMLTRDPEMWNWMRQHMAHHPDLALGGPSVTWLNAAFREMQALATAASPSVPVIATLGTAERIVCPRAVRRRMATWQGGRLELYPRCEHEVMMEVPQHRDRFHAAVLELFGKTAGRA